MTHPALGRQQAPGLEPEWRHRSDVVNGIALHSVTAGSGPAVLLLHGWPETWWEWRHLIGPLARHFHVVATDLRGFGDSAKPPPEAGYDVATVCADLAGLLDALDLPSAYVCGHDLGGLVGYALARLHPARVARLVLADAPLPLYDLEVPAWAAIEKQLWHQRFHRVPYLPEALIAGREHLYLSWHFAQSLRNIAAIRVEDVDEYVRCYSMAGGLGGGFAFSRAVETSARQVRAAAAGGPLEMPLLFLGGAGSLGDVFKPYLGQIARQARTVVVPDCGHWIPEENPQFVLEELLAFYA